jgi:hypothetical protein
MLDNTRGRKAAEQPREHRIRSHLIALSRYVPLLARERRRGNHTYETRELDDERERQLPVLLI